MIVEPSAPRLPRTGFDFATVFALSLLASLWCLWTIGPGLGLFLAATILTALYVPPITLAVGWGISIIATGVAVSAVWLFSLHVAGITLTEWARCCLVLWAFVWALTGLSSLAVRTRLSRTTAAAVTSLVALLWLTWPVWLSHALNQTLVDRLVVAHPLFAINSVLQRLGTWDRAPLAYQQLTVLNQDVPYVLPHSIGPAVLLHGFVGLVGRIRKP